MKRKLTTGGILLLLFFLLRYPAEALCASRAGMTLWLNTLIPTLLPFLILTGFLLHTDGIEKVLRPFSGFFKKVFGLSSCGAYALILGLLCGYPMGAKLCADLYRCGKIDCREAEYLLTFSNNASPAFLTTYLAHLCLGDRIAVKELFVILLSADVLCMLFFRFAVYKGRTVSCIPAAASKKETSGSSSPGAILDVSIMNGFETITRLGGYILLFSVLSALINHFWTSPSAIKYLLLGSLEVTTGLNLTAASGLSFPLQYLFSMTMTAFGGFCIMAQTKSVLGGKLSIRPYAYAKCLNAFFTAILVLVFGKVI